MITNIQIINFLKEYFHTLGPLPEMNEKEFLQFNFMISHIDSFGIISFLIAIEDKFCIELSAEDTESDEFRTVGGLIKIIQSKTNT